MKFEHLQIVRLSAEPQRLAIARAECRVWIG